MPATFTDNTERFMLASYVAVENGLRAKADVLRNALVRNFVGSHGYTSSLGNHGDFYRDGGVSFITISGIDRSQGQPTIRVGSSWKPHLFWEVGHHNIFTRHFERDEVWRPTFEAYKPEMLEAYARAFRSTLSRAGFRSTKALA